MAVQRVVVTHRRAHPVWAFIGLLIVVGAIVHYWYVLLAAVLIVAGLRAKRRLRAAERSRELERSRALRAGLTASDREWLGSHGWTG